ncbi:uncharacterized protein LOC135341057 isoform X2 [Halichondria panicea]|uniref:uncharacterized protein LOC135341057 isoform X2 n=1 Tax=Halichondria panicea TaxID=6063 RepID=UPI00312BB44D
MMPGRERVPLLARVAGSRVIGPRPGKAIVSFWQGIIEIILRAIATVLLLIVLIPAGFAMESMRSYPFRVINLDLSQAGCVLVIVVGVAGAAVQAAQIILRFVNVGAINMTFRTYGIDIVVASIFCFLLLVGAIITGYSANLNSSNSVISTRLGATAGVCFPPMIALVVQGVWMLVFVIFKWNKHVVTYTIKKAVFG